MNTRMNSTAKKIKQVIQFVDLNRQICSGESTMNIATKLLLVEMLESFFSDYPQASAADFIRYILTWSK